MLESKRFPRKINFSGTNAKQALFSPSFEFKGLEERIRRLEARISAGAVLSDFTTLDGQIHYFFGKGKPVKVNISRVARRLDIVHQDRDQKLKSQIKRVNRQIGRFPMAAQGMSIRVDEVFGWVEFNFAGNLRGVSRGWILEGTISAQPDRYDFNPSSHRRSFAEIATRFFRNTAGGQGQGFQISFIGAKRYRLTGSWS